MYHLAYNLQRSEKTCAASLNSSQSTRQCAETLTNIFPEADPMDFFPPIQTSNNRHTGTLCGFILSNNTESTKPSELEMQ